MQKTKFSARGKVASEITKANINNALLKANKVNELKIRQDADNSQKYEEAIKEVQNIIGQ